MLLLFSTFLFQKIFADDSQAKPDDYLNLPLNPQSGNKYFSFSEQNNSMTRFDLTNSILKFYYCAFTRTIAYIFQGNANKGIIHIIFNNKMDNSLIDVIDIKLFTLIFNFTHLCLNQLKPQ